MNYALGLAVVIAGTLAISAALPSAFGHDGRLTYAEPISFDGMEVTVHTSITPHDLSVGSIDEVNLKIRFFDLLTDNTFEKVEYRVEIWKAGDLLVRNFFYDDDGILYVEVRPDGNCDAAELHQCISYGGSEHTNAPGALYVPGTECNYGNLDVCARPIIKGPVFDKGGLYNIKIDIVAATGPKMLLAEPLTFDTFVSVTQEHDFLIRTAHAGEIPVVIKSYYDDVGNFAFDPSDNSITFDMPFDWSSEYVGDRNFPVVVHEEIQIPSSFAPYSDRTQFKGYVDGVEISRRTLINDPYSMNDVNIIHFLVLPSELKKISAVLGPEHHFSKNMNFRLVPISNVSKSFAESYLVDPVDFAPTQTNIRISWNGAYGAGQTIPFEFAFFDSDRQLITDVWYEYSVIDESGQVLFSSAAVDPNNPLIPVPEGIAIQDIHVPTEGLFRIDVHMVGAGLDFNAIHSGIGSVLVEIGPTTQAEAAAPPATSQIPAWIKNNVVLWADDAIGDAVFMQAIQFLVQQGIIDIPPTEPGGGSDSGNIPAWIKNNVVLWADDAIGDAVFIQAIQFLVQQGIIVV